MITVRAWRAVMAPLLVVAAVVLLATWRFTQDGVTDPQPRTLVTTQQDATQLLESMDARDIFDALRDAAPLSVGSLDESSRLHRAARGDLARREIVGFQALGLEPQGSVAPVVTRLTFWVAHTPEAADEFLQRALDDHGIRTASDPPSTCGTPGAYAGTTHLEACLARVDKVVLMSVAREDPFSLLEAGIESLRLLR